MVKKCLLLILLSSFYIAKSQLGGAFSGAYRSDMMYYLPDEVIGVERVPDEKVMGNNYFDLRYQVGKLSAGVSVEGYLNKLVNTLEGYEGIGVLNRYLRFNNNNIDVTAGTIHEQFGSGLLLRTFEDRNLGINNGLNGFRAIFSPTDFIRLKGVIGHQRNFMEYGEQMVRGIDAEIDLDSDKVPFFTPETSLTLGASFVNKFEENNLKDSMDHPLPKNVDALNLRAELRYKKLVISGEWAGKSNDPAPRLLDSVNYDLGSAGVINLAYSQKGFGVSVIGKRIYNMDYRSHRNARRTEQMINFIPTSAKQHTSTLASVNPYATQPNNELSLQIDVNYLLKRKTLLGGKYGTKINANVSFVNGLEVGEYDQRLKGHLPKFIGKGPRFFRDYNLTVDRKLSRTWRVGSFVSYQVINWDLMELGIAGDHFGEINSLITTAGFTYIPKRKHSLVVELQHVAGKNEHAKRSLEEKDEGYFIQYTGNWLGLKAEYAIAPQWSLGMENLYNYGNPWEDYRLNYPTISLAKSKGSSRIELRYAKSRKGLSCLCGVCIPVEASHAFRFSMINSF